MVICVIDGTAGIGKTALAVRFAHRVARQYEDGQLYVNLRGFDPRHRPCHQKRHFVGFFTALACTPDGSPSILLSWNRRTEAWSLADASLSYWTTRLL